MRFLGFFLTWWGAALLAALDSSMVFFLPFGIDTVVIYLAARDESLFWIYPVLAAAGSVMGAAITYWIGHKAGEVGLERLVPEAARSGCASRVREQGRGGDGARRRCCRRPFPLTPFVLTCGALNVDRRWFFSTFAAMRLLRFGVGARRSRASTAAASSGCSNPTTSRRSSSRSSSSR